MNIEFEYVMDVVSLALEEVGIYINTSSEEDIDLKNLVETSLQYISIIVSLEEMLKVELPDELLLYDSFDSFKNLCENIYEYLSGKNESTYE